MGPNDCVHRWRIEEPHDGLRELPGECSKCGAVKMFITADPYGHESWAEVGERQKARGMTHAAGHGLAW